MPPPQNNSNSPLLNPLRAMLAGVDEAERKSLVASLAADVGFGAQGPAGDQFEQLNKRFHKLEQEKVALEDALRVARADLTRREKQVEGEQSRGAELQRILDDQRRRFEAEQQSNAQRDAELVARNSELHKAEVRIDELTLQLQRAKLVATDQTKVHSLQDSTRDLSGEVERLRAQVDQVRRDKDAEIARLQQMLSAAEAKSGESGEAMLSTLWQRLAATKPPLVEGHLKPNVQAAERLIDAFIELVRFADEFDKSMRVFLNRYTKYNQSVKVPWDAYAKGDDLYQFAQRTIAAQGGRPVGPFKMRLRLLHSWVYAATVGCDSAIESIGSELQTHLLGPLGTATDPNRKIRDYIRADGHLLFSQHIGELRSLKLAETYGRG